jgi:hypothetical protein
VDNHRGWAVFSRFDDRANPNRQPKFDLAFTSDAGATWTKTHLAVPPTKEWQGHEFVEDPELDGWDGIVVFADAEHGLIALNAGTMHSWLSLMLTTSDGGRSWKQLQYSPAMVNAHALMVTPSDIWLFGGDESLSPDAGDTSLYVSRDRGDSWRRVSLTPPKEIAMTDLGPASCYIHGLPTFENSKQGFLEAGCGSAKRVEHRYSVALFVTNDGGQTWKPDRLVSNVNDYQVPLYNSSAVADSDWIFVASPGRDFVPATVQRNALVTDHVIVTKVGPGAKIDAKVDAAGTSPYSFGEATKVSFATDSYGWIIVGEGYLKSTTDGGATWNDIVPGPKPHVIPPLNEPAR